MTKLMSRFSGWHLGASFFIWFIGGVILWGNENCLGYHLVIIPSFLIINLVFGPYVKEPQK